MAKRQHRYMGMAITAMVLATQAAVAEVDIDPQRWYGGFGLGMSRLEPDDSDSPSSLDDKRSEGYRLTLGYDWSDRIAIEGYYADLGEAGMSPSGGIDYTNLGISGLYYLYRDAPQSRQGWAFFFKGGYGWLKNDSELNFERVNNSQLSVGLGGGYSFGHGWTLRADYDHYSEDAEFLSLNLIKRLGVRASPQEKISPLPEPVMAMPVDSDADGITDDVDLCPDTPAGTPVRSDGCALVLDGDGDGVKDADDRCPQTPAGSAVNTSGCVTRIELEGVNFEHDEGSLTEASKTVLDQVVAQLKQRPDVQAIQVIGHTDDKGPAAYNQKLSEKRARAVVDYLISKGIDSGKLSAIGKGETQPIADNATEAGRERNRRVELELQRD